MITIVHNYQITRPESKFINKYLVNLQLNTEYYIIIKGKLKLKDNSKVQLWLGDNKSTILSLTNPQINKNTEIITFLYYNRKYDKIFIGLNFLFASKNTIIIDYIKIHPNKIIHQSITYPSYLYPSNKQLLIKPTYNKQHINKKYLIQPYTISIHHKSNDYQNKKAIIDKYISIDDTDKIEYTSLIEEIDKLITKNIDKIIINRELNKDDEIKIKQLVCQYPDKFEKINNSSITTLIDLLNKYGKLADYVILYRENDKDRKENLDFTLKWINKYFGNIFRILIVEMDNIQKFNPNKYQNINYNFLYNPNDFNRGWGYNCALKRFVRCVVSILADNDILLGHNFIDCIIDCYKGYDCISPYKNIYFTNLEEKKQIILNHDISKLNINNKSLSHPVTFSGGLLVIKRSFYMDIGGFEQYYTYGCEDRAMDVTIFNTSKNYKQYNNTYVHLYHGKSNINKFKKKEVTRHLNRYYRCGINSNKDIQKDIHKYCNHQSSHILKKMIEQRKKRMGDYNLYKKYCRKYVNTIEPYIL